MTCTVIQITNLEDMQHCMASHFLPMKKRKSKCRACYKGHVKMECWHLNQSTDIEATTHRSTLNHTPMGRCLFANALFIKEVNPSNLEMTITTCHAYLAPTVTRKATTSSSSSSATNGVTRLHERYSARTKKKQYRFINKQERNTYNSYSFACQPEC